MKTKKPTNAGHADSEAEILAGLDTGIRRTVALLRAHGFNTCDSGDGKSKGYEWARDHGHVSMRVHTSEMKSEADRLLAVPINAGVECDESEGGASIQAMYSPKDGLAILEVGHIDDSMLFAHASKPAVDLANEILRSVNAHAENGTDSGPDNKRLWDEARYLGVENDVDAILQSYSASDMREALSRMKL